MPTAGRRVTVGWAICCLVLFAGCERPDTVFEQQIDLGHHGWAYADSLEFSYNISDTSSHYDLVLTVGHRNDFAHQNFYVELSTSLPDGKQLSQPLSLQLADNFGEWYGNCSGDGCVAEIALQEGVKFSEAGEYRLAVSQFSREDTLVGVSMLGFRVVRW